VNAWMGPRGTVTPLHTDPHHNIFVQVAGRKYFQLFAPGETPRMYAHASGLTTNSSLVDAATPDYDQFPLFRNARGLHFTVGPGDALYIPPGACLVDLCLNARPEPRLHAGTPLGASAKHTWRAHQVNSLDPCRVVALCASRDAQHLCFVLDVMTRCS
jgi:hypothetical protein